MKISAQNKQVSFTRALTTSEKKSYINCINQAKKELGLNNTTAIIFDYLFPSTKEQNIGIGTSFSKNAQTFVNFLKEICGINSIQLNPQGILKDDTVSPYSGTFLSIGEHIIDLFKLTEKEFGCILSKENLENYIVKENPNKIYNANYEKLVRQDYKQEKKKFVFSSLLQNAYQNFSKLNPDNKLKIEYKEFCKSNEYRLDSEALYYGLSEKYGSTQWQNWKDYQNLFIQQNNNAIVNGLKQELKNEIDYFKFVQFIASKQQQISKKEFNKNGVKLFGDIQISFSPAEQWANKSVFSKGYSFGYFIDGEYKDWGSPAPDMDEKISPLLKKIFENRFRAAMERYDGVRVDAAWELVNPCLVKWNPIKSEGKIVNDLGYEYINLIEQTAKKIKGDSFEPEDIFLELIGDEDIIKTVEYTKNKYTHTLITANLTQDLETVEQYIKNGYNDAGFTTGIGTHDNTSLIELSEKLNNGTPEEKKRILNNIKSISKYMNVKPQKLEIPEFYRVIKFAELFTTRNQFFNIFDILGSSQIINEWDKGSGNFWRSRVPINYEEMYYKNLINNKGLNLPESLTYAFKAKFKNLNTLQKDLIKQLEYFAKILKTPGPLSENEANMLQK